jgi:hypothetical protein
VSTVTLSQTYPVSPLREINAIRTGP